MLTLASLATASTRGFVVTLRWVPPFAALAAAALCVLEWRHRPGVVPRPVSLAGPACYYQVHQWAKDWPEQTPKQTAAEVKIGLACHIWAG